MRRDNRDWQRHRNKSKSRSASRSRSRSRGRKQREKEDNKVQWQVTKCLAIQDTIDQSSVQAVFDNLSIQVGTSLPDEILVANRMTLIQYPSAEVSSRIMSEIKGKIEFNGKTYQVEYYPKRDSALLQDWYCDKCGYINFARRNKCNKCENERNSLCRPAFNSSGVKLEPPKNRDEINTCSLMLRGPIITQIEETVLLDIFEHFGSLKDVRMIRNKMTGLNKDFAFLEFYTPEEAAVAYREATNPNFRIQGEPITCLYSKNRKEQPLGFGREEYGHPRHPKPAPTQNYCQKQRERQIREEKKRQIITIEKLKQKKEQEMKKLHQNAIPKELSKEKLTRKQAEQQMKKWQRSMKVQNVPTEIMYICPLCVRKFKDSEELKDHEQKSALHKRMYDQLVV